MFITEVTGAALRGPPGDGGDNRGLSNALESQSFFTGGGTGVPTVAIDTSPVIRVIEFFLLKILKACKITEKIFKCFYQWFEEIPCMHDTFST